MVPGPEWGLCWPQPHLVLLRRGTGAADDVDDLDVDDLDDLDVDDLDDDGPGRAAGSASQACGRSADVRRLIATTDRT
jgi:hypothetical protein